jgi:hypothetical protein
MKENLGILSPVIWFSILVVLATVMFAIALTYFVANSVIKAITNNKFTLPKYQFAR